MLEAKSSALDDSTLSDDTRREIGAAAELREATMAARQETDYAAKIHEQSAVASQNIDDTGKLFFATMGLIEAGKQFDIAFGKIVMLARAELNHPQPVEEHRGAKAGLAFGPV